MQLSAPEVHRAALLLMLALCPLVFGGLMLLPASYGRHKKDKPADGTQVPRA